MLDPLATFKNSPPSKDQAGFFPSKAKVGKDELLPRYCSADTPVPLCGKNRLALPLINEHRRFRLKLQ